jgi:hypothetical protein
MAEKAGFEGEGEVEFRSPEKIRDARDEGFQVSHGQGPFG